MKAARRNKGKPDVGHFSVPRLREALKLASKLGLSGTLPPIKLPPEDYDPPEQFCAGWDPGLLTNENMMVECEEPPHTLLDEFLQGKVSLRLFSAP